MKGLNYKHLNIKFTEALSLFTEKRLGAWIKEDQKQLKTTEKVKNTFDFKILTKEEVEAGRPKDAYDYLL